MGRVTVSVDSNVESVISDIDDVQDDLSHELRKRVGAAMRVLWADARQYVLDDPHHTGDLFSAIKREEPSGGAEMQFSVHADLTIAAHAAIVEYGTGKRTNIPYEEAENVPPGMEDSTPPDFPYDAPDIDYDEENPMNTGGYPTFYGFVKHIEEWMVSKPVAPMTGDYFASAALIAATIIKRGNYAHPYLRPAWFDNELEIRRAARNAVKNAVR